MKTESFSRVTIATSLEAEEPAAALLETLFGEPASSWTNAETGQTLVSVFPKIPPSALRKREPEIHAGLAQLEALGLSLGRPEITIQRVPREDWSESWKKYFKTIEIGEALLIKPSWSKQKPKKKQAAVVLDPGLSFGTGQHATTSFCLQELVRRRRPCQPRQPQSFLDIGTGSGILAISAAKLGYAPVEAFDFDPLAVRVARENCRRNRVTERVKVTRQDLAKLKPASRKKFTLICANLISNLLIEQRAKILARLAPGGTLVLAGILASEFAQVRQAFEKAGLKLARSRVEREWQSGAFTP